MLSVRRDYLLCDEVKKPDSWHARVGTWCLALRQVVFGERKIVRPRLRGPFRIVLDSSSFRCTLFNKRLGALIEGPSEGIKRLGTLIKPLGVIMGLSSGLIEWRGHPYQRVGHEAESSWGSDGALLSSSGTLVKGATSPPRLTSSEGSLIKRGVRMK